MTAFPDFGKELRRPFEVDERCFDCAELYHGCNARRADPDGRCGDCLRLPDVGLNGATGQEIPPSRMGSREEPRVRLPNGSPVRAQEQREKPPAGKRTRAKPEPIEENPPAGSRQTAPGPDPSNPAAIDTPPRDPPSGQPATRQQSPAAVPGPDGQRSCTCGTLLRRRERCCAACRAQRRQDALNRYWSRTRPSTPVQTA
jgi:hypothetical protein